MGKKEWEARMRNSLEGGKEELKGCFGLPFLVCRSRETVFVEERPCCQSMSKSQQGKPFSHRGRAVTVKESDVLRENKEKEGERVV